jgi:hypothetical protein
LLHPQPPRRVQAGNKPILLRINFPNYLIHIFKDPGHSALTSTIKNCGITQSAPFLIYNNHLASESISLLPIQLPFGNGAITFAIDESDALNLIEKNHTSRKNTQNSPHYCTQFISEIVNQFWSTVRRSCQAAYGESITRTPISIPIIVKHKHPQLSFGNRTAQLGLRYSLRQNTNGENALWVEFRIIFNSY